MNKRLKSLDIARISQPGRPSRGADSQHALADRSKTPRLGSARYTRHGLFQLKQQETFRVRDSVADLVKKELDNYDRCTFYQRVFVLAKNLIMTESIESSVTSILDKYMQSRTNINENVQYEEEQSEEQVEEEGSSEFAEEEQKSDAESRISLKDNQLLQITRSDIKIAYKEKRYRELDFFELFRKRVEEIVKKCEFEQLSDDKLTGLLLCMGNSHTLFVLEGTEDSVANFCQELLHSCSNFLETSRVFLVEDRIEETYFNTFIYRRSVAMNINEKFPPPTANDPQLMGPQHWLIKEKLRTICSTLSEELRPKVIPESTRMTEHQLVIIKEEEVVENKMRKRKSKRHRKKSPKRDESPITETEDVDNDEDEDNEMKRDTTTSIRFQSTDKIDSSLIRKSETERETQVPALTRASNIPKDSMKSRPQSILAERKLSPTEIVEEIEEKPEKADETPAEPSNPFALNPSTYVRLLPEIQRIELVLTSKRFYLDFDEFVRFSNEIPMQEDEDAMIWPTCFSYLPLKIFDRLPFDVNLTFADYGTKETEDDETSSSDVEEK